MHGEPGAETGFARYRPIDTDKWFVSDQRTIVVEDFFAPDINTYLGLLRFLLGLDLIDRVLFWMLPVDDPLPWLLLDRRAARVTATHDETWLRVVDVEKALSARQYEGQRGCIVAVDDRCIRQFDQRGYHRRRRRTNRPAPQLRVGVAGLAAVLLGGATWRSLALAGLARAEDPSVLAAAERLFAVHEHHTQDSSSKTAAGGPKSTLFGCGSLCAPITGQAEGTQLWNHANVLCLSNRTLADDLPEEILRLVWRHIGRPR